ncbi:hypothetical protein [Pontibacter pamirensis]|uniref:hypothetical protein n=1 Tax=Pontibacter pamirensis TaxID=2562824 RepID=UPI00138A4215|nr:hypothetical protein [Pontibacter pamirensis]
MSGTYTISESNGKDYINLTTNNQTEAMEIISIDGSAMSWSSRKDNAQYFHNGLKTTDHAIISVDFSKK